LAARGAVFHRRNVTNSPGVSKANVNSIVVREPVTSFRQWSIAHLLNLLQFRILKSNFDRRFSDFTIVTKDTPVKLLMLIVCRPVNACGKWIAQRHKIESANTENSATTLFIDT
jgi:hypothetical protein